jgi:hypothetical protein
MAAPSPSRKITPSMAKKLIVRSMAADMPIFLWGPPGIGKSDVIWQIGKEQGRPVIDIRLLLMNPTDIKGIPFYNPKSGLMEWAPPTELPLDPDSTAIVFFDEMNAADRMTMGAALQIVLNKRIGPFTLGPKVSLIAAGNRETDRAVANKMPSALANRFQHQELVVSTADWTNWASVNRVSPLIVGYIDWQPGDLFQFDPASASRAFATPRSWSFANRFVSDETVPDDELTELVIGCVGEASGLQFMAYRKKAKKLPSVIDILTGRLTSLKSGHDLSVKYSLAIALGYKLQEIQDREIEQDGEVGEGFNAAAENFFRFILGNFEADLAIMAVRRCLDTLDLMFIPGRIPSFDAFVTKHHHLITGKF